MHPLERLINLVALLLDTNKALTFEEIRRRLGAYDQADRASAKRQFERDKDLLRQIGIPVEVAPTDVWEVEEGYRIPRERYELPDISFSPEEAAALFVASHAAGEHDEASQAFRKLLPGAGRTTVSLIEEGSYPAVDASGPHLEAVAEAIARRRALRFRYRPAQGEEMERTVDAWGLVFRRGTWYAVGRDRERGEIRAFRLSRLASAVQDAGDAEAPPEEFRAAEHLMAGPWGVGEPETTARIAFSPKIAFWAIASATGSTPIGPRDDGWTEADVPATAGEGFVSWVLSFGPDAELLEPPELRDAVVSALEEVRAGL